MGEKSATLQRHYTLEDEIGKKHNRLDMNGRKVRHFTEAVTLALITFFISGHIY